MKKIIAIFSAIILSISLCACSRNAASDLNPGMSGGVLIDKDETVSEGLDYSSNLNEGMVDGEIYNDPNAKIIRTATLTLQTIDFDQSVKDLAALTEANGGYYETAQIEGGSYYDNHARRSAYYIVRIPKENFVAFRDSVGTVGHIYSIEEGSENVGEVYYDTELRLETLKVKQDRLLALLEKAELMEDIISLENSLAEVQYEMDRLNTQLRKYDSLIDYSTFTIHMNEVIKIVDEPGPEDGFGAKLLAQLSDGFSAFANGVLNFILWFARNIITLAILAVIIFVAISIFKRLRRKKQKKAE